MNWIISPIRNGFHNTLRAVDSFLHQDIPGGACVLLIDNGKERIGHKVQHWNDNPEWRRRVWVVDNADCPKSVAASWNQGLDLAFGQGNPYAMIAANDVVLRPETYRLLASIDRPFLTPVGVGTMEQMADFNQANFGAVLSPHPDFSAFLIRRDVFMRHVGRFDEEYTNAYAEDNDYHVRMHVAGYGAWSVPIPFFHERSATIKQADPETRDLIVSHASANRKRFREKWGFGIPTKDNPDRYDEFFSKPRAGWQPFKPETWVW